MVKALKAQRTWEHHGRHSNPDEGSRLRQPEATYSRGLVPLPDELPRNRRNHWINSLRLYLQNYGVPPVNQGELCLEFGTVNGLKIFYYVIIVMIVNMNGEESMNLLSENKKMKKASIRTFNWSIPAFKSRTGLITCPMAGDCAVPCYAQQGAYRWKPVYQKHEANLKLTKTDRFVVLMHSEIETKARSAAKQGKTIAIRIHDSGDFYSLNYLMDWVRIIKANPTVQFYAYTKMVPLFKRLRLTLPPNFTVIDSEGGKADNLIDQRRDRPARVFSTEAELLNAGYANASSDDTVAWRSIHKKIGLVYHGAKSKSWSTAS